MSELERLRSDFLKCSGLEEYDGTYVNPVFPFDHHKVSVLFTYIMGKIDLREI